MSHQHSTSATSVRKSKKKRKKSATTSPRDSQNKKSKILLDGDIDTDIEYLSATEYTDSSQVNPTMANKQKSPGPSSEAEPKSTSQVVKFSLDDSDREDIAQRVRTKLKDDLSEIILELTKPLLDELAETKARLAAVIDQNSVLKSEVDDLRLAVDEQEQYSRRSCLRINGIIGDEGAPTENVESKLLSLAESHNIPVKPEDIDIAHRLGKPKPGYTRPVIVKFTNAKARQRVLAARKSLGDVYVNEDLTQLRQSIHYHARKLVKDKKLERTWVAGGKVFCRFPSSTPDSKVHIRSMEDIECIRDGKTLKPPQRRNQVNI